MEDLMTPDEAADHLRVDRRTLANWRHLGKGPAYVRIGQQVRYPRSAVEQYVQENTVTPGGEA